MKTKFKYKELVFIAYLLGLISFLVLKCQEITSQELATATTLFVIPYIGMIFRNRGTYKKITLIILAFFLMEFVRSYILYGQSIQGLAYVSIEMLSLFLYIFFMDRNGKLPVSFGDIIIKFAKFELFFLYVVVLLYNFLGINILDEANVTLRYGNARVYNGTSLIICGMILVFSKAIYRNKMNDPKNIFFIFACVFYLFYGCQSRMLMLVAITIIAGMYTFCNKIKSKKIIVFFITMILGTLFLFTPWASDFILTRFGGIIAGTDSSVIPRVDAIYHFFDVISEYNNEVLGMGLMNYSTPSNGHYDIQYILRGEWGAFYTNDVGYIGLYFTFGCVGLILYAYLIIKMLKIGLKERFSNPHKLGIAIYILLLSITATFFDVERQAYITLLLICSELNFDDIYKTND